MLSSMIGSARNSREVWMTLNGLRTISQLLYLAMSPNIRPRLVRGIITMGSILAEVGLKSCLRVVAILLRA